MQLRRISAHSMLFVIALAVAVVFAFPLGEWHVNVRFILLLILVAGLNCRGGAKLAVAGPAIQISTAGWAECLGNGG
jgi:hypothetical protein